MILTVVEARPHGRSWRVRFEGMADRDEAEVLTGTVLSVDASRLPALPEGTYYSFQLLGLRVVSVAGEELGRLDEIVETGARDVYVVLGERGEILLPSIPEVVREVDLETGTMTVELIPGLVPDPVDESPGGTGT
jgi:16S rRNA processing protein RimM